MKLVEVTRDDRFVAPADRSKWGLKDLFRSMSKAGYNLAPEDKHAYKDHRYLGKNDKDQHVFAFIVKDPDWYAPEKLDLHSLHSDESKLITRPPKPEPTKGPYFVSLWFEYESGHKGDYSGVPAEEEMTLSAAKQYMNELKLR